MGSDRTDDLLHFNGINIATGGYGLAPMTSEALARSVQGQDPPDNEQDLRQRCERDKLEREGHLGVIEGVDPLDLAQAGWGVIFPALDADPAIEEALGELLKLRHAQAGARFRLYSGPKGYRAKEKKSAFLDRHGAATSGPADPEKVPYYLLLVGSPEQIPYSFQYQLDVQYAVGRLWFPTVEQYAHYARSVVEAERGGIARPRRMSLFGVRNPDDRATDLSAGLLVEPLSQKLRDNAWGWEIEATVGEGATRAALETRLGGDQTPALLFTASHGAEFPLDHARQRAHQGALLCSDWPGPRQWQGEIPDRFYFAGEHLAGHADVAGMMLFCFACFGAGTPKFDEFARLKSSEPRPIAPESLVAGLPIALLGRPGGALAVVGHVDRAWGCSFTGGGPRGKSHTATFQSALERLLQEQPVGYALDYFNGRYAELSTELSEELQDEFAEPDPYTLSALWTANNDARGYVVFGDPAARLAFEGTNPPPVDLEAPLTIAAAPEPVAPTEATPEPPARPPRPPEISEADWERTPLAVQRYIDKLRS